MTDKIISSEWEKGREDTERLAKDGVVIKATLRVTPALPAYSWAEVDGRCEIVEGGGSGTAAVKQLAVFAYVTKQQYADEAFDLEGHVSRAIDGELAYWDGLDWKGKATVEVESVTIGKPVTYKDVIPFHNPRQLVLRLRPNAPTA
jgi:hypothetical protein